MNSPCGIQLAVVLIQTSLVHRRIGEAHAVNSGMLRGCIATAARSAGTPIGITVAVEATYGITDVVYREAWQWDPGSPEWARFWLICAADYGPPISWDDAGYTFDEAGLLFDMTGVSLDTLQFLKRQVRRWKAAHAKLVTLSLLLDGGHVFEEPDLLWDGAGLVFDSGYVAAMESP